jgi:hypothetical protein
LVPNARFCGTCGASSSGLLPRFAEAKQRFRTLQERYRDGELGDAAYDAELEKLVIEDETGAWMMGAESGDWYWYDGRAWVRREPPRAAQPPPPPGVRQEPSPPPPPSVAKTAAPAAPVSEERPAGRRFPLALVVAILVGLMVMTCLCVLVVPSLIEAL